MVMSMRAESILHNAYAVELHPILKSGGFLYYTEVLTSSLLQSRNCLIHYNDSLIYINYSVDFDGESQAFVNHPVKGLMEYFEIGDYRGMQQVIVDADYVSSFNLPSISCIIGLGAGNTIFRNFRITPQVLFSEESNDGFLFSCDPVTDYLCSFPVDVYYNGAMIGGSVSLRIGDFSPLTRIPVNIYNSMIFAEEGDEWRDVTFCASGATTSCFTVVKETIDLSIHEYESITVRNTSAPYITLGLTAFYGLDIAYEDYGHVRIKQRAVALSTTFYFQFFIILVSIVAFYFLSTPPVHSIVIPEGRHLFETFKIALKGVVLFAPFGLILSDGYFAHLQLEIAQFSYFMVAFQGTIAIAGLFALLFHIRFPSLTILFRYLPTVSIWNFLFFASLFDFIEGNPSWGHVILFQFVIILLYDMCIYLAYDHTTPWLIRLVFVLFWAAVSTTFNLWSMTLFIVPPLQRIFRIFDMWIILFYPLFTAGYYIVANYCYAGDRSMIFYVNELWNKKNV